MRVITGRDEMQKIASQLVRLSKPIGFVPTMGALHKGHISLVREAKAKNDFVVVSIFVNPTQFGPHEDLTKYPRTIERDMDILKEEEVDYLFFPAPAEIYPDGYTTDVRVKDLSEILEGKTRPGHFTGVATVVTKLFNIVLPTSAYFGQKDLQQVLVVKKLIQDLNFAVNLCMMPIVRESDGLALSSRNVFLSSLERRDAAAISHSLILAEKLIRKGECDAGRIKLEIKKYIDSHKSLKIDYIAVCNPDDLSEMQNIAGRVAILLAIYAGKTRLIDNAIINVK